MIDIEPAVDFRCRIQSMFATSPGYDDVSALDQMIESRDAAIRKAARSDVLSELCIWYAPELSLSPEEFANTTPQYWPGLLAAIAELNTKYQSADSQPAQDGERR